MAMFEKFKNAVTSAKDTVAGAAETAKTMYEQKKAEQEAHINEMNNIATQKTEEIITAINSFSNETSVFQGISKDNLLAFTKDFYDKLLLPANSVTKSQISMFPYISDKQIEKFSKIVGNYDKSETALVYLRADGKKEFIITDRSLYFVLPLVEDPKFCAKGRIDCNQISAFMIELDDGFFSFKCDEYTLSKLAATKTSTEDYVTLNNYFNCIRNHDFEITDEEVDSLIREKIGPQVCQEIKKYMVYDDELLVYFAWGLDSLSAKDYIVCTSKQIIVMDRELLGATANVKQFYYEDITSASTEQNSKSTDLTGLLLDTAITAATKTCDLLISVAGSVTKINTLYKVEAERVVAVYHQYRKMSKMQSATPQQVVVQAAQIDPLEQLEKLAKLKEMGVITEDEFNQKKAELLSKL